MTKEYNRFIDPIPELRALIYYLTADEGGRKSWIGNGYRGQFYYDGRDWDACQTVIGQDKCLPGETVDCYLTTGSPQYHLGKFYEGKEFEIREGARIVGRGVIIEVLYKEFEVKQ